MDNNRSTKIIYEEKSGTKSLKSLLTELLFIVDFLRCLLDNFIENKQRLAFQINHESN